MRSAKSLIAIAFSALFMFVFLESTALGGSNLKSAVIGELGKYYNTQFGVSVSQPGVVTITGTVPSYWDKLNVYRIVAKVHGVQEIKDDLDVRTDPLPDDIIKSNIEDQLMGNQAILEPAKINIKVENGLVLLSGTVSFAREKEIVDDVASWQPGVVSVADEIQVLPTGQAMSDQNLTSIADDLIARDFPLQKGMVSAKVQDGTATLTGKVNLLWTKDAIAKDISEITGIKKVDNQIQIQTPVASKE